MFLIINIPKSRTCIKNGRRVWSFEESMRMKRLKRKSKSKEKKVQTLSCIHHAWIQDELSESFDCGEVLRIGKELKRELELVEWMICYYFVTCHGLMLNFAKVFFFDAISTVQVSSYDYFCKVNSSHYNTLDIKNSYEEAAFEVIVFT